MANYHFIGGDGKTYGPYPLEKLQEFQQQNRLDGESKVQKDGGEFRPANEFPELAAASAPVQPAQPAAAQPEQYPSQPHYHPQPQPGAPYYPQPGYDPNIKPGKVQAIAVMTLVGGILATIGAIGWGIGTMCIWIPFIYGLVYGIMAIIKGAKLLGSNPWPEYLTVKTTAIMGIVNIINCDWINMTMGIIILVFLNDPQVRAYMRLPAK